MSPTNRKPSNIPASIHALLLRLSQQTDQDFNAMLVRFAAERLLYRRRLDRNPAMARGEVGGRFPER